MDYVFYLEQLASLVHLVAIGIEMNAVALVLNDHVAQPSHVQAASFACFQCIADYCDKFRAISFAMFVDIALAANLTAADIQNFWRFTEFPTLSQTLRWNPPLSDNINVHRWKPTLVKFSRPHGKEELKEKSTKRISLDWKVTPLLEASVLR